MGRFASTVGLYEELRPPYPPMFFREVAQRLRLSRQRTLIDLGTGPGLLALGFAPFVAGTTGVDPEPKMLAAAQQAAARAEIDIRLIKARVEDLPPDIGAFDVVTIGRALHWMDREATLRVLARLVARDGAIAVCASFSARDDRNAWLHDYNAVRRVWSNDTLWAEAGSGERTHRDPGAFFAGSAFHLAEVVKVETRHEISARDLARRVLTFSSSSPEAVGENVEAMLRDVTQRLMPYSRDGFITEVVASTAQIVAR
jgi:SAM-dependent methyltransferase